jgi:hypothetical protein
MILSKVKAWFMDKAVVILLTLVVSLAGALGTVSYLYNEKLTENAQLLTEKKNLAVAVEGCEARVRTLLLINGDIVEADTVTDTAIDDSHEQFSDLLNTIKDLQRKKDCASQVIHEETTNEQTENSDNDAADIDTLYRVLFHAHCLSAGSGSCDDT